MFSIFSTTQTSTGWFHHPASTDCFTKTSFHQAIQKNPLVTDIMGSHSQFCTSRRGQEWVFSTPRTGNISIRKRKLQRNSCTHTNPGLSAHSCAAPEPLQDWSPNLLTEILFSQLQQQLPTPLGKAHTSQSCISHCLELCHKDPSSFSYTSIPALIPLLFVLHISRTLWKLTCCNSNLDRGMDRKHSRKHLVEWNKLAPALITEMLEWVVFFLQQLLIAPEEANH